MIGLPFRPWWWKPYRAGRHRGEYQHWPKREPGQCELLSTYLVNVPIYGRLPADGPSTLTIGVAG